MLFDSAIAGELTTSRYREPPDASKTIVDVDLRVVLQHVMDDLGLRNKYNEYRAIEYAAIKAIHRLLPLR